MIFEHISATNSDYLARANRTYTISNTIEFIIESTSVAELC